MTKEDSAPQDSHNTHNLEDILERVRRILEARRFIVFAYIFRSRVHRRYALKGMSMLRSILRGT